MNNFSRNLTPTGLDQEEAHFYGSALTNIHCYSLNTSSDGANWPETARTFGTFLDDVAKMPAVVNAKKSNPASSLYVNCLNGKMSNPDNVRTCLSAVSANYGKYGGILGPVPTTGGEWLTTSDGTTLAYPAIDGSATALTSTLAAGPSVKASVSDGNFTITDQIPPGATATFPMAAIVAARAKQAGTSQKNRNPFYCSAAGYCETDGVTCACDSGYYADSGTCRQLKKCTTASGGSFAPSISVSGNKNKWNSSGNVKRWSLSTCTPSGGKCLGPDGNTIADGGTKWSKSGVRFGTAGSGNLGPLYQYGEDAPSAVANKDLSMDECGLCLPDDKSVGLVISEWNVNPKTCTNGSNFGCCSGTCYTKDEKYLVCGCRCDGDCPSGYMCEDGGGSCVKKDCWAPRTAVSPIWGNNCCHYQWPGVMCADATDGC